jgi:hypothetical protein
MDYESLISALRDRARKFTSLDTPKDGDLADTAIDIASGFVPVVGTATSGRDFERARREDDKLGMALSSLGMIPVVGGVTKGVNKLRKGGKAAEEAVPSIREALEAAASKADDVGYDRAKIAQQYPDTAPAVLAKDKKTGKEFLQKENSAEALAVEKVRKAAQKEIDKGNYTPYFDVSKRTYADASKYPLQGATVTDALPKKQATIDKWKQEFDTPEVRENLRAAYLRGNKDPLTKDWYATGQLEKEFIKEYGPKVGRAEYKEAFPVAMAATTGGADPTANLLMSYYGNFLRKNGQEMPKAAHEMPYPIGGRYASGNMAMYDKVINQGAGLTTDTPKRFNFASNFMGHLDRPTIDEQMSGLYKPGMVVPPGDSYGVMEQVLNDVAKSQGVKPVNFQDVAWAGAKGTSGKPMIQHVNEAIERTARVTGKTPEEVVRDSLVRRTHPLYGVGAAGLAGAGAASMNDQEDSQ